MFKMFRDLDRIIRGAETAPEKLREGRLEVRVVQVLPMLILMGAIYGACMGAFGMINRPPGPEYAAWKQLLASALKVPALFILTLFVTFPSLYVFNALVGSRLDFSSVGRLLFVAITVSMTVLASMATIVLFFTLTTESYSFMLLLNVAIFAVSGVLGLMFLRRTLDRLTYSPEVDQNPSSPAGTGPLDKLDDIDRPNVVSVFRIWMIVYALVGAQMSWILRPFVGSPELPFQIFRPRSSNFFEAVWQTIEKLFS